jgi:uncharacterized DUF497 family protein
MAHEFDWDAAKATANYRKHGISFTEAMFVFSDERALWGFDEAHSTPDEDRWFVVGVSQEGNVLVVAFADSGSTIRLISARRALKRERHGYETQR